MKWHLVHKDGREWTQSEINDLEMPSDWTSRVGVDLDGQPILLGRSDHYCYADEVTDDMVAVIKDD